MCGEKAPRLVVRERLARVESRHVAEVRSCSLITRRARSLPVGMLQLYSMFSARSNIAHSTLVLIPHFSDLLQSVSCLGNSTTRT